MENKKAHAQFSERPSYESVMQSFWQFVTLSINSFIFFCVNNIYKKKMPIISTAGKNQEQIGLICKNPTK